MFIFYVGLFHIIIFQNQASNQLLVVDGCDHDHTNSTELVRLQKQISQYEKQARTNTMMHSNHATGDNNPLIHMFWSSSDDELNVKVKTAFISALRTQKGARLILWTLPRTFAKMSRQTSEFHAMDCPCAFELRSTNELVDLVNNDTTLLKSCAQSLQHIHDDLVGFSDLIRFIVLYYFGGIYADSDMIFLKDLCQLQGLSFAYKWDRNVLYYNTALIGLEKYSPIVPRIIARTGACNNAAFYPTILHEKLDCSTGVCTELIMMPTALFSPVSAPQSNYQWQEDFAHDFKLGTATDWFFDRPRLWDLAHFFPGAYTFHWHNQWAHPVHNESFFSDLQRLNSRCHRAGPRALITPQPPFPPTA